MLDIGLNLSEADGLIQPGVWGGGTGQTGGDAEVRIYLRYQHMSPFGESISCLSEFPASCRMDVYLVAYLMLMLSLGDQKTGVAYAPVPSNIRHTKWLPSTVCRGDQNSLAA